MTTKKGKLKYQIRLRHKPNEAKWVNGDGVEKMWEEFKNGVMEMAVVRRRKKCGSGDWRTRW